MIADLLGVPVATRSVAGLSKAVGEFQRILILTANRLKLSNLAFEITFACLSMLHGLKIRVGAVTLACADFFASRLS